MHEIPHPGHLRHETSWNKFTHNSFLLLQIWNKRSYLRLIEILQETADAGINPFWKTPFTLLVRACLSPWLADSSSTHFLTERSARCCWPLRAHYFLRKSTSPGARCVTRLISELRRFLRLRNAPRAAWRRRDSRSWKQLFRDWYSWADKNTSGFTFLLLFIIYIIYYLLLVKVLNDWMTFSKSIIYNLK